MISQYPHQIRAIPMNDLPSIKSQLEMNNSNTRHKLNSQLNDEVYRQMLQDAGVDQL